MKVFFLCVCVLIVSFVPSVKAESLAKKACGDLSENLRSCTPYACSFQRALVSDQPEKKVLAAYNVLGWDGNGFCEYNVSLGEIQLMDCKLNESSIDTFADISEMQLDGTFTKKITELSLKLIANPDEENRWWPNSSARNHDRYTGYKKSDSRRQGGADVFGDSDRCCPGYANTGSALATVGRATRDQCRNGERESQAAGKLLKESRYVYGK